MQRVQSFEAPAAAFEKIVRVRTRLVWFLSLIVLFQNSPASAWFDRRILPERPTYRRNVGCTKISAPPFVRMPVSQGDSAICYAYAASDMISQRIGMRVSALDVATSFYFANPAQLYDSRDKELRRYLAARPTLLDDIAAQRSHVDVSAEDNRWERPYFDKLEGGEEDTASLLLNIRGVCLDRDLPSDNGYETFSPRLEALRRQAIVQPERRTCERSIAGTIPKLHDPIADVFNDRWVRYVDGQCRRMRSPAPLLPVAYRAAIDQRDAEERKRAGRQIGRAEKAHMFAIIDYALDHGRTPAIGYSFYVLEARAPDDPDEFADHSSVVLARRKVGGVCRYLIQDDTGELCFKMRPTIAARCVLGRIWLTEPELEEAIYSVTYLR